MNENSKKRIQTAIEKCLEAEKQLESWNDIEYEYSLHKSSFLASCIGAIIGASFGLVVGLVTGRLMVISGPAGLLLGAILGVIVWRGRGYNNLERANEKLNISLDEIEKRMMNLPQNTPIEIRHELCKSYKEILTDYTGVVQDCLRDQSTPASKFAIEKGVLKTSRQVLHHKVPA